GIQHSIGAESGNNEITHIGIGDARTKPPVRVMAVPATHEDLAVTLQRHRAGPPHQAAPGDRKTACAKGWVNAAVAVESNECEPRLARRGIGREAGHKQRAVRVENNSVRLILGELPVPTLYPDVQGKAAPVAKGPVEVARSIIDGDCEVRIACFR